MEIESESTLTAWKNALNLVLNEGTDFEDENRVCREVLNLSIKIKKPEKDINKPIEILNSLKKWVYPPLDEIEDIILSKKFSPVYRFVYGPRLFNFDDTVDQINNFIIPLLESNKDSRRAVVTLWNPKHDSDIFNKSVPGLISLDFKLRNNRLNVTAIIRSNDLFFGWPANVYQIYCLQEYVRKKLNCLPGSLTTFSTCIHVYKDQIEDIKQILGRNV